MFNAIEILPCADRSSLHMGARTLKIDILEKPRNHAENPGATHGRAALQCAMPPRPAREEPDPSKRDPTGSSGGPTPTPTAP
mgnify:FL=1